MQTEITTPNVVELVVQRMLDGVGSGVKDVRCIMRWILPVISKLTKFGCHLVFNINSGLVRKYKNGKKASLEKLKRR